VGRPKWGETFVNSGPPNLAVTIVLYTIGILLVMTAVLILLKALRLVTTLPNDVIVALVLLAIGSGIIGGLQSAQRKGR
jgi:hypothetical protein